MLRAGDMRARKRDKYKMLNVFYHFYDIISHQNFLIIKNNDKIPTEYIKYEEDAELIYLYMDGHFKCLVFQNDILKSKLPKSTCILSPNILISINDEFNNALLQH
jgi:hypothetical protein